MVFVYSSQCFRIGGVDGRDHGEVVLISIEVVFGDSDGFVEWVGKGWVVRSER